jgi:apolipoprotein N-acyltransferase
MTATLHRISPVAAGALAVIAAGVLVELGPGQDVSYPLFMLGGPLLTGLVLGPRWRIGAAAWLVAGLFALVVDWIVNHEDVLFHAVVAGLFVALVALGGALRRIRRA